MPSPFSRVALPPRCGGTILALLTLFLIQSAHAAPQKATAQQKPAPQPCYLMAHYMPWYEADAAQNRWGWHWTMNHFDPSRQKNGRREAASRYYPLVGLYDSSDPDVLEYHVLTMKYAGIDGVIADWYGTDDLFDYANINRNTEHLTRYLKKAGMKFAVMYEEQTVPKLLEAHRISGDDVVAHGQKILKQLQDGWFQEPGYLKLDGKPVFPVFGGGYYKEEQWNQILGSLSESKPALFTEDYRRAPATGAFFWVNPRQSKAEAQQRTDTFYKDGAGWGGFIAGAYPRFHDIYQEAGLHDSYGKIEDEKGAVFTATLEQALQSKAPIVQLITWNDWGEGTNIEPSAEFGYRDLETTQRLRKKYLAPGFAYSTNDLRLPLALYNLRKKYKKDVAQTPKLNAIADLLFAGKATQARALLQKQYPGSVK